MSSSTDRDFDFENYETICERLNNIEGVVLEVKNQVTELKIKADDLLEYSRDTYDELVEWEVKCEKLQKYTRRCNRTFNEKHRKIDIRVQLLETRILELAVDFSKLKIEWRPS